MLSTIISGAVYGVQSHLIQVEVDVSQGLPCFQIVGLPGSEVREARERVKVALKNVGVKLPPMCINVNLSPADLPKNGTMFDLPVAVGIMAALGKLKKEETEGILLLGELGLSGELKPVKGVLPIAREAAARGIRRCLLPAENAWEGALVRGMESRGAADVQAGGGRDSTGQGAEGVFRPAGRRRGNSGASGGRPRLCGYPWPACPETRGRSGCGRFSQSSHHRRAGLR